MHFARTPKPTLVVCLLSLAPLSAATASAQTVTRGPYLQRVTASSIVVRWRTSTATDSQVKYGTSQSSLTGSVSGDVGSPKTEHELTITGLSANTRYFYSVGTTAKTLSSGADHFFRTAPTVGSQGPTRIWAIGDFGTKNTNEKKVRDSYAAYTNQYQTYTNVWLMLGDNAYTSGTDSEYQSAIFDATYAYQLFLRQTIPWPTIGNHDAAGNTNAALTIPYYQIFTLPKNAEAGGLASGTERYYSFDYANVHFVCLDSQTASGRKAGSAMLTWLANDLASTNQRWIIAYWHHPPYSRGTHRSDSDTALREMRQNAGPILEDNGVDLVLTGHSHNYERSFLIDSHYGTGSTWDPSTMLRDGGSGRPSGSGAYRKASAGPAPHDGAVYAVVGASGNGCTGTGCGPVNYPAMYISIPGPTTIPPSGGTPLLGSLVVDVNGGRLDAKYLRETGAIEDDFTILKGQSVPSFSIGDVTVNEGTSGTKNAVFTVTLAPAASSTERVRYQTVDGTATTANNDYTAKSGTLTFTAGTTSRTVSVSVIGDTRAEPNETFSVRLQNPDSGTAIADGTGLATIVDSTNFTLTVTKSGTGSGTVTSSPSGINCGSTCSAAFGSGTAVNLTAAASSGSSFSGWSGSCSGTGACQVTMSAARSVGAAFTLQGGSSPIFEKRVASSADDAEQDVSTGSVGLTSSDLEMAFEASVNQAVGLRFTGVNVPRGASITNAWIQFKVDETGSSSTSLTFQGQAADNAATFTTSTSNVSSRAKTTASVNWAPAAWTAVGDAGAAQRTPNLAPVVQEIVNRSGWSSGNALAVIVTGSGTRVARSYDGESAGAALLHVEYGSGGGTNQPPSVSAGPDRTITLPASASLDGTVSDDGRPGPLTTTWSKVSGPGTVTFANANAVGTTASFSTSGVYTLRLTANDGAVSVSDDVVVTVNGSGSVTIFEKRVAASSDDAEQNLSSGSVDLTSSDLEMAFEASVNQATGIRFTGINVPRNATVINAWIQFKVDETGSSSASVTFQGQAADNAATFTTSASNVSSRAKTTASVNWAPAAWTVVGEAGAAQRTPSLAALIQEIVNRSGWASGNALAVIVTGSGTRVARSYDGESAGAALLHIEYQ